jgi:8-amino-7-oxononanoate synthase
MNSGFENASNCDVSKAFRLDAPPDAMTLIGGKSYVYFGGDGYLGLQADPNMISVACNAALKYGLGAATSRNCYTAAPVQEVEKNAALFLGTEKAYYTLDEANIADLFLLSLSGVFERAFVDETALPFWNARFQRLNGLSADGAGAGLNKKELVSFKHGDPNSLREKLEKELRIDERPLLITDGISANFGSIAPLREYENVLDGFGESSMLIDDSHGIGVLGLHGRGTLEFYDFNLTRVNQTGRELSFGPHSEPLDLDFNSDSASNAKSENDSSSKVNVYMFASLAKAVGGFGVIAAGSELFIDKLVEYNQNSYAVPPNSIAAATAYSISQLDKKRRERNRLQENIRYLRSGLRKLGFVVEESPSPVVAIQVGTIQNMRRIHAELELDRVLTSFLPVKYNDARGVIRIAVFASHTCETIDMLLSSLKRVL